MELKKLKVGNAHRAYDITSGMLKYGENLVIEWMLWIWNIYKLALKINEE